LRRGTNDERQCLVPRAEVGLARAFRSFGVYGVGDEDMIDPFVDEVLDMSVRDFDGKARLRHRHLVADSSDFAIRLRRGYDVETQFLEVGTPEREAIEIEHRARNSNG